MEYNKEYFIKKFEAIPEHEIGKGDLDCHCALWHCGVTESEDNDYVATEEATALGKLLLNTLADPDKKLYRYKARTVINVVWRVNDSIKHKSAKENILVALKGL